MTKWNKKLLALILAGATALSLAACGNTAGNESGAGGETAQENQASSEEGEPAENKNEESQYEETRNISIAVLDNVTEEEWKNDYHQYFMDKFNIQWDYNYVEWGS